MAAAGSTSPCPTRSPRSTSRTSSPRAPRTRPRSTHSRSRRDGILGDNTDGAGLVRDLCDNLGLVITNRRVLVIGAGGATRGILAPLLGLEPTSVVIANRTPERAEALAAAFSDLGATQGVGFEHIESRALRPDHQRHLREPLRRHPADPRCRHRRANGVLRPRLRQVGDGVRALGEGQGLRACHAGLGMLVEQAAESFRLWRGVRPATARVLDALRERTGSC